MQWRTQIMLLILLVIAMRISHEVWFTLWSNFSKDKLAFTGREAGILQSLREVPGFLAFGVVFLLLLMKEQLLAFVALVFLGIGVGVTGFFPTEMSFYTTTVIMSIGFHYYETAAQSLALQWVDKKDAPHQLGRILAAASFAAIAAYAIIYIPEIPNLLKGSLGEFQFSQDYPFKYIYLAGGLITLIIVAFCFMTFPTFPQHVEQNKKLVLRRRYWLYYALTFFGGARRQIFIVFAAYMMVEKFGYPVIGMATLFLVNHILNMFLAPRIGKLIGILGERRILTFEYIGLILVFISYAFVTNHYVAAGLYIIAHFFFAMAIAMKTYCQKIADPADIAPTAGVAFSINHIAAVFLPVLLGYVWIHSTTAVFLIGAGFACCSLVLSRFVPITPTQDVEFIWKEQKAD